MSITEEIIEVPSEHVRNVFGAYDQYIKTIERSLNVTVIARGGSLKIIGDQIKTSAASRVIHQLITLSVNGNTISQQNVDYAIALTMDEKKGDIVSLYKELVCHTAGGKPIRPKTQGQKDYIENIRDNMIVFGVGPAGTGKTSIAHIIAETTKAHFFKNFNLTL